MNTLYDLKLKDGTEIKGCYFKLFTIPVGIDSKILYYVPKEVVCYNKNGEPIDAVLSEKEICITKIYEEDTGKDLTESVIKLKELFGAECTIPLMYRETI